jgi:hypothetical protein
MGPTLPLTDPDPQNLLELLWLQAVALQEQGQHPAAIAAPAPSASTLSRRGRWSRRSGLYWS